MFVRRLLPILLIATPALAQPFNLNLAQRAGRDVSGGANKPGVYVRDSAVAAEKLALAQRMEHLKEWNKSADVYQEIIEKFADRVVPTDSTASGSDVTRYTSVTLKVQALLGKWPPEGLAVYRARYESQAQSMLDAADIDDVAALNRVVQRYFPTEAAKKAALRLMELDIENGEFSASAWLGERLLATHPSLGADEPTVIFRTALAEHMAGNESAAKASADDLKQRFPNAIGTVMGKDATLADAIVKLIDEPVPVPKNGAAESWPMLGGDPSRGRVPDAAGRPGANVASISLLPPVSHRRVSPSVRGPIDAMQRQRRELGLNLCVMPVIDRGELFYQDNSRIYAVSVDSGIPLPGWSMNATTPDNNRRTADAPLIVPGSGQLSVTVTDSSVLAILGQGDRAQVMTDFGMAIQAASNTQLLCVDRATGAKRWSLAPSQFPDALANLRTLKLNGSPLVVGDNVYVAARGGTPMQFEDSYVVCASLTDGRLRWACYLASGNAPGEGFGLPALPNDAITHLAYAGGRIYAVTNLGAVASIDAYTGTIAWLTLYPKPAQPNNPMMAFAAMQAAGNGNPNLMSRVRKPWAQNPAIVLGGMVFALPSDSPNLMIYDAATGEEKKRISMADYDNADTLLGVIDEKLIVCGPDRIDCINWKTFDPTKGRDQNLIWSDPVVPPGSTEQQAKDVVRGRGFVTSDSVFLCTKNDLRRFAVNSGKVVEFYPHGGAPWPGGEGPGNILVTQDQVIIAGSDAIVVYSDLQLARAKLDKAVADAPTDPAPRLKYAETLFAAGAVDEAVAKLDDAIGLLGGLNSMRPGADRDGVFARAMTFAERSADPKAGLADPARVYGLFDRAAAAASSPAQQVAWRISRAHFAHEHQDIPAEIDLYQSILLDAKYRAVAVPNDDHTGTAPAASIAETNINDLLKRAPQAYAKYEQAAKSALATAQQGKDPQAMLGVAQTYPNATVAVDAMFAASDAFEAAGKNRSAVGVLNLLYSRYRDVADKPRLLESQARTHLPLPGGIDVAIARLNEGAKLNTPQLTRPLKLPDGSTIENVTFGAAAELLQKYSADIATAALPEFNLPATGAHVKSAAFLPETPQTTIQDVERIVQPPRELGKLMRFDRIVTWGDKGVSIYAVGTNTPMGTCSTIHAEPRGGAWVGNDLLVWTTQKLWLLRGDNATLAWQADLASLAPVEITSTSGDAAPAPEVAQRQVRMGAGGNIVIDNMVVQVHGGRVVLPNGVVIAGAVGQQARRIAGNEQIDHVRPVGDRVVIATSNGRFAAIELGTGQVAWQTRPTDATFDQVVNSDDFIAARFNDDFGVQIVAMETFSGQIVWQKTFLPESGQAPVNMTLSPDGTLIYTMPDRLCGVDLYEAGKGLKFGDRANPEAAQVFSGAAGLDQLVVADGRVLALADGGQYVRVLSPDKGTEISQPLPTNSQAWNVSLRVVGPHLYVINQHSALGYDLAHPDDTSTSAEAIPTPSIRDAFIGKRHLVLLDQPASIGGAPDAAQISDHFRLLAYARYPRGQGRTGESGKLDQTPIISHPAGIDQWQPVEGGFYYRSIDRQAHFLKGAYTGS